MAPKPGDDLLGDIPENHMMFVGASKPKYPAHGQIWYDEVTNTTKFYDGSNWVEMASGEITETQTVKTFNPITTQGIWHLELIDYGSHRQLELKTDETTLRNIDNEDIINKLKNAMGEKEYLFLEKEIIDFLS